MPERKGAADRHVRVISPRQWRVDVLRTVQVHPVGIRVRDRESGACRQLTLQCQSRLHNIGGAQAGTHCLAGLIPQRCKRSCWGNRREKIRIGDHVLLLNNSIVTFCQDDVRQREATVENAKAGTQHGLGARVPGASSGSPGNCYARCEISPVVDVALGFISESEIQCYVRTHLPLVTGEHPDVYLALRKIWDARIEAELRSSAAQGSYLCR